MLLSSLKRLYPMLLPSVPSYLLPLSLGHAWGVGKQLVHAIICAQVPINAIVPTSWVQLNHGVLSAPLQAQE
jgi:hypothetical protein